jgi:hypothetical protein
VFSRLLGPSLGILWLSGFAALGGEPLAEWTMRNPRVSNENLYSITFGNGMFVAVGGAGTVCTSADGVNWQSQKLGTHINLLGVTHGGGQFVAVGGETHVDPIEGFHTFTGAVFTSRDGVAWVRQPASIGAPLYRVTWSGNRFVALGSRGWSTASETYAWSDNGSNWVSHAPNDVVGYGNDVTFNGTKFVSVSGGAIRTSVNGVSWTTVTNLGNTIGVAADGERLVTVGGWGLVAASLDGGATWTQAVSGTQDFLYDVSFCNNRFVAVGNGGRLLTSADGLTWTSRTSGTESLLEDVTWGNGTYVAVGRQGAVVASRDSQSWSNVANATSWLNDIAYGSNLFVAVGPRAIYSSTNRTTWRSQSAPWLEGVCFGNGCFVAVGARILLSSNGVAWTDTGVAENPPLSSVRFGNGIFVAVGGNNSLNNYEEVSYVSTDGVSWLRTGRPGGRIEHLAFGDGKFWAGTTYGIIGSSTDGVNWTWTQSLGAATAGLAAGNGLTVRGDVHGTVHTYRGDERIATTRVSNHLTALSFAGGQFFAMGGGWDGSKTRAATLSTSTDGVRWTTRPYVSLVPLNAAAYGGHRVLLAGGSGTILESGYIPSGCGLTIARANDEISIQWTTLAGVRCQLQSSSDLRTWSNVGPPIMGNGDVAQRSVVGSGRSFFRVMSWE